MSIPLAADVQSTAMSSVPVAGVVNGISTALRAPMNVAPDATMVWTGAGVVVGGEAGVGALLEPPHAGMNAAQRTAGSAAPRRRLGMGHPPGMVAQSLYRRPWRGSRG